MFCGEKFILVPTVTVMTTATASMPVTSKTRFFGRRVTDLIS